MSARNNLREIFFLDVEASGLQDSCFPIEVGFVRAHDLSAWSTLIQPTANWLENGHWDGAAESLHQLTMEQLRCEGRDVMDVVTVLNMELAGKVVYSDAPEFDRHWLEMLFDETLLRPAFDLRDTAELFGQVGEQVSWPKDCSPPDPALSVRPVRLHRAKADATRLAIRFWSEGILRLRDQS